MRAMANETPVHHVLAAFESAESTPGLVERKTGKRIQEANPFGWALHLWFLYQTPMGRLLLRLPVTWWYLGWQHRRSAAFANSPRSKSAIPKLIKDYQIDVSTSEQPPEAYDTLQQFFTRRLKPGLRPIAAMGDNTVAVMPADSRCVVFKDLQLAHRVWIKGSKFSVPRLMGVNERSTEGQSWDKCAIAINRLGPADCHRLHASVSGRITKVRTLGRRWMGSDWVATHSRFNVMTENERLVMEFETADFGRVVQVMVGASEIGTIVPLRKEGDQVTKGDEVAVFEFGGSIMATLFGCGAIEFDEDLHRHTAAMNETLVCYGDTLGRATGRPHQLAPAGGGGQS